MGVYWTGGAYRWKPSRQRIRDLDSLARRLKRAYWIGTYGRVWTYVERVAYLIIVLSVVTLAATVPLP